MSHPLRSADPTTATMILKSLVPDAKVSLDSVNRNLVAIATPEDHKLITSTIEKLQSGRSGTGHSRASLLSSRPAVASRDADGFYQAGSESDRHCRHGWKVGCKLSRALPTTR